MLFVKNNLSIMTKNWYSTCLVKKRKYWDYKELSLKCINNSKYLFIYIIKDLIIANLSF